MRHVWKVLVLLLAFLADTTISTYIGILEISPSFLLAVTIAMAMASTPAEAGVYGFLAGVLMDVSWGRTFGFYTLLFLYTALGARMFLELVYKNTPAITAGTAFVASFLCDVVLCVFGFTVWGEGGFLYAIFRIIVPKAAYTAIAELILFYPVMAIAKPKTERRTRL